MALKRYSFVRAESPRTNHTRWSEVSDYWNDRIGRHRRVIVFAPAWLRSTEVPREIRRKNAETLSIVPICSIGVSNHPGPESAWPVFCNTRIMETSSVRPFLLPGLLYGCRAEAANRRCGHPAQPLSRAIPDERSLERVELHIGDGNEQQRQQQAQRLPADDRHRNGRASTPTDADAE